MSLIIFSAKRQPFCLGLNVLNNYIPRNSVGCNYLIRYLLVLKKNCVIIRLYCSSQIQTTVYPKKYAHGFVVLCFVVVMQSFIMNSHEVFIHIHQGCFAGTGAIVRLPQCQWSKPDGYGKISQCITTTKHSKAKTVCIFLGIYCKCHIFCLQQIANAEKPCTKSSQNTTKIWFCNVKYFHHTDKSRCS